MKEIYKDVKGYEGLYQVSNLGNIKGLKRQIQVYKNRYRTVPEKIMTKEIDTSGYLVCNLSINGIRRKKKIHRLVAIAFIPNPQNKPQINHKDGVKSNNKVTNLEWCTSKENMNHAVKSGLKKATWLGKGGPDHFLSKQVEKYDLNMNYICDYPSVTIAAKKMGIHAGNISKAARGIKKTCSGFIWKYKKINK